jgi:hypothetical protein
VTDPSPDEAVPTQYVVAHLRELLAHDERVAALDVQIRIVGSEVFLTGTVSSPERRAAVEAVVREEVPHLTPHNQLDVLPADAPSGREEIA